MSNQPDTPLPGDDDNLPSFMREDESPFPLVKVLLSGAVVMGLLVGGFMWVSDGKVNKEADAMAARARDQFEKTHYSEGLRLVNQALSLKEKPEYLVTKADILNNQNRPNELKLVLKRIVELQPDKTHYRFLLANLLSNQGDTEEALQEFETVCEQEPNSQYQMSRAYTMSLMGNWDEAEKIYIKARDDDPENHKTWEQLGLFYVNNSRPEEALKVREEAVEKFPDDYLHRFFLARELDGMGKKEEAVRHYRESLEMHPLENSIAAQRIYEITGKRVPPALEKLATDRLPYKESGKLMYITADINEGRGKFLLDTNTSLSVVYRRAASKYHLTPSGVVVAIQTGNGVANMPVAYGNIRVGQYTINNVRIAIAPDPQHGDADGIIGMNVWEEFQVEFDRSSRQVVLKR